jgi:cytosine/adenosine deaminase-related metal-dependent hydrolase
MPKRLLRSAWLIPIDRPPLRDGAIVFTDRILDIGEAQTMRRAHPDAVIEDLGDVCILPALINAHAHLELSHLTPGHSPRSFADWLLRLAPRSPSADTHSESREETLSAAISACLKCGVATLGDITTDPSLTRPLLQQTPVRIVSYGEVRAMAARKQLLEPRLAAAADRHSATDRLLPGISPHAPYSIDRHGYERCLQVARQNNLPLATHLAESPPETEFLARHTGPFRDLWDAIGGWDDCVPTFTGGPIRYAQSIGLLDYPTLLAHVNYADDDELNILARGRASVVYCPRTHAYFGHPPHRWLDMLGRNINVALGTDSTASSPDLNLLADLRLVHQQSPRTPPHTLWEMVTLRAARALMLENQIGSLTPGKSADLALFPAGAGDPLLHLLRSDILPQRLYVGGACVHGFSNTGFGTQDMKVKSDL